MFIYGLTDPTTEELRYVGLTTRGMKRINEHIKYQTPDSKSHYTNWMKSLQKKGLKPGWFVIEEHSDLCSLAEAEDFWIQYFTSVGSSLVNGQSGGYIGIPNEATRKKMSEAQKGRKVSKETRLKSSVARKGKKLKPHSAETKAKMSKIAKARPPTIKYDVTTALESQILEEYMPYKNGYEKLAKKYGLGYSVVKNIVSRKGRWAENALGKI